MDNSLQAIIKTLIYSDIFDYPLRKEEVWEYLVSSKTNSKQKIFSYLTKDNNIFSQKNDFYFLKGREGIIEKRLEREKQSFEKIRFTKKIIRKLSLVPTVDFIGISGALSMKNSEENDDIDLFVICKKKSVWSTRFMLVVILKFLRVYRGRGDEDISNKICLNFLIDKTEILFPRQKRDLYTAHEIAQIWPLFSRNKTYENFINKNDWVKNFLPNISGKRAEIIGKKNFLNYFFSVLSANIITENLIKKIQFWHMKKNITKETITESLLAFHPFDYRNYVLNKYKKKSEKLI